MAYLATPVLGVGSRITALDRTIDAITLKPRIDLQDVYTIDPTLTLRQIELISSGTSMDDIARGLLHRDWRRQSIIILLPSRRSLLEYLLSNPSACPDGLDRSRLKGFQKRPNDFRVQDFFSPLITDTTSIATYSRWLNAHPVVYSTTHKVAGARVRLFGPAKLYILSPDVLRELSILKSTDRIFVVPTARVYVGCFPSASTSNCVLTARERWDAPDVHPVVKAIQLAYDHQYRVTARYLSDPLVSALLLGNRSVKTLKVQPVEARAARSVGIRVQAMTPPRGINTSIIQVIDLRLQCRHSLIPTERPFPLTLIGLPSCLLHHLDLTLSDDWVPIRDHTGMFEMWFMILTLTCDKILDGRGNAVFLIPSSTNALSINYVQLTSTASPRPQSLAANASGRIDSIGLCMPKGSFKSTMIKFLTGLEICGTRVMYSDVVMDSDDVGDALDPTFETALYDALLALDPPFDVDKLASPTDLVNQEYVASHMYPTFLRLVNELLTPKALELYSERSVEFRSLTYAHADSEFLNACWTARLMRCFINYHEEQNILLRPGRIGGVLFQVALSRCYKMFATSTPASPLSLFPKSLFVPWIESAPLLASLTPNESSRVLAWYIPSSYWSDNGWCTCDAHRHVTFSFIRGLPADLSVLDLFDWSRFRATINVDTSLVELGADIRAVKVSVHWTSQKPTVDVFDNRALFTPFQHYHLSLHCNCAPGRPFFAKNMKLYLSTVGGEH
uniref:Minor core protein muA n=1 Tax=Avian orthoreovirus TaxID=38170 RepID=Q5QGX9_9REOV|nr:minor core protein muA [Avian orthoreovirus]